MAEQHSSIAEATYSFFSDARFSWALSVAIMTSLFGLNLLKSLLGVAGLTSLLITEALLAVCMSVARRRLISWRHLVPISLVAFLAWAASSYFWSYYPRDTFFGVLQLSVYSFLAFAIVANRDVFQIIRAVGDSLRALLVLSILLEIFSGIIFDMPFTFLGIKGNIVSGQGIQGIFGSRNLLILVSIIAIVTFVIELRTNSIKKETSIWSLMSGFMCLVLSVSALGYLALLVIFLIALLLFVLRKQTTALRRNVEFIIGSLILLVLAVLTIFRGTLISELRSIHLFSYRVQLWAEEWRISGLKPLEGWGWVGNWPGKTQPFTLLSTQGIPQNSGLNAYLDCALQIGIVGLVLLGISIGISFVRLWKLAVDTRPLSNVWPALVLTTLVVFGLVESTFLNPIGIFLFVLCAVQAHKNWSVGRKS